MKKQLVFSRIALKELQALPEQQQYKIVQKLTAYADGSEVDVKKLSGRTGTWRLRHGDYRVIFKLELDDVIVIEIGTRQGIYR